MLKPTRISQVDNSKIKGIKHQVAIEPCSEYLFMKVCKQLYLKISLENNAIPGGFVILQTSIFSLDFFLFRFRLSSQGSSRPLFFRCDYSDRFRCQSKVGIFCKSCVRVETTLRASLSSALLRFLEYVLYTNSLF